MMRPLSCACPAALLLCAVSLLGCGSLFSDGAVRKLARTGVQGATQGLSDTHEDMLRILRETLLKDDTLEQIAQKMTVGAIAKLSDTEEKARVASLVAAMTDALRDRGDAAVARILKTAGAQLEETLSHVAADSLRQADREAKELLRHQLVDATEFIINHNARGLAKILAEELRGSFGESLQHESGQIARAVVDEALQGLRSKENQAAAHEFLQGAMAYAVRGLRDELKSELKNSPTEGALIAGMIALGTVLVLIGALLWFFVREYRMSTKALSIIAQKINEGHDDVKKLKQSIHQGASRNNVESWFSDFLKRRGL